MLPELSKMIRMFGSTPSPLDMYILKEELPELEAVRHEGEVVDRIDPDPSMDDDTRSGVTSRR